jgi:hypothetical protein
VLSEKKSRRKGTFRVDCVLCESHRAPLFFFWLDLWHIVPFFNPVFFWPLHGSAACWSSQKLQMDSQKKKNKLQMEANFQAAIYFQNIKNNI